MTIGERNGAASQPPPVDRRPDAASGDGASARRHLHVAPIFEAGSPADVRIGARVPTLIRALRPLQWTKNGILFAALVFDRKLLEPASFARTLLATVVFCLLSSGVYLVNDVGDAESDRLHPLKRRRPIAAGELAPRLALIVAAMLFAVALAAAWVVRPQFAVAAAGYVVLMVAYSAWLKRIAIVDVFTIAAGFVIRAVAGAVAIAVAISPWLLLCTMLLALFLGFGKRRHELSSLPDAASHRANLGAYSVPFLDQLIAVVAAATVMAYAFYTFDAAAVPANHSMMLTVPVVTYAIFRYLYLIQARGLGGSPESLLLTDRPLLLSIATWAASSVAILYLVS
jgi:4-hydroxybenzoate polyprenyltransferase